MHVRTISIIIFLTILILLFCGRRKQPTHHVTGKASRSPWLCHLICRGLQFPGKKCAGESIGLWLRMAA
jgi:hypothetical protein